MSIKDNFLTRFFIISHIHLKQLRCSYMLSTNLSYWCVKTLLRYTICQNGKENIFQPSCLQNQPSKQVFHLNYYELLNDSIIFFKNKKSDFLLLNN